MKSKTILLGWRVLPLIGGAALILTGCNNQDAELAAQRGKELEAVRAELEQAKASAAALQWDVTRLRKDNEELLRLRNEVRQLREDKQQLASQVQAAQSASLTAQQQQQQQEQRLQQWEAANQAAGGKDAAVLEQLAAAYAEAGRPGDAVRAAQMAAVLANQPYRTLAQPAQPEELRNACLNNLRQIDGAKQQWALENRKTDTAIPNWQDVTPYIRGGVPPTCPAGGTYTLNTVSLDPTCSIPGHALPPP